MTWEYIFPKIDTGDALQAETELRMDNDAFAQFYERSARSLWAYLSRVSGDPALSDDLMQESYVRLLCASCLDQGEVACRRYLFRIATNLLHDHWRRPKSTSIEQLPEELFAVGDGSASLDSKAMLVRALALMRPRDRQLLWLAHAESYSHHEIAEITGLGKASVRLLLFRARRKIAHLLREQTGADRREV
jgi:RNA polymerase sigma-70 factor (ECF subfamily)